MQKFELFEVNRKINPMAMVIIMKDGVLCLNSRKIRAKIESAIKIGNKNWCGIIKPIEIPIGTNNKSFNIGLRLSILFKLICIFL
jgi:hypothetical protein